MKKVVSGLVLLAVVCGVLFLTFQGPNETVSLSETVRMWVAKMGYSRGPLELGVLEKGSEVEMLIDKIGCGRVSEPGDYEAAEKNIRWFIDNVGSHELADMGKRGYEYLVEHLTKDVSVKKYIEAIKAL